MKKYWKSVEELEVATDATTTTKVAVPEFSEEGISEDERKGKSGTSRRDFLKMLGFSVGYATLAASCETPVQRAIPYLIKPEEVTPGVANFYASSFFDGNHYCSVLVKTREGRPIKIEGNEMSSITRGGTSAQVQASVLSLYDSARLRSPLKDGQKTDWATADKEIMAELQKVSDAGGRIVILSSTIISPSTKQVIADFATKYKTVEHVSYDAVSASAMLTANKAMFGKEYLPDYRFEKADIIVSFAADFLGTWISPIEYSKAYSSRRQVSKNPDNMSEHIQIESNLSLTGSNSDYRIPIKPSQEAAMVMALYNAIAKKAGAATFNAPDAPVSMNDLANELWAAKGKSLIIAGSNNLHIQVMVNAINELLGNYGNTLDLSKPVFVRQGDDAKVNALVDDMNNGKVGALLVYNANPAYDYGDKFTEGLKKVGLTVALVETADETSKVAKYVCPDHHYLESWNDAVPKHNCISLVQPTIQPLFDTRQAQQSLLTWSGAANADFYTYMQTYWQANMFGMQSDIADFGKFWNKCLHDGVFEPTGEVAKTDDKKAKPADKKKDDKATATDAPDATAAIAASAQKLAAAPAAAELELVLYEKVGIGNGKAANNPWLQELPDPVTKSCWDNYVTISYDYAQSKGLKLGDKVKVNDLFELPVLIQPGQANGTAGIALGYGRTSAGKVADNIGQNAFKLVTVVDGQRQYSGASLTISATGSNYVLALTQSHHDMEGREIVRSTTLDKYKADKKSGNEYHFHLLEVAKENTDKLNKINKDLNKQGEYSSLYPEPEHPNHRWALGIDLTACTGCSACVIACQAENNVPVIGREEVIRRRIMHWIRLDRYYSDNVQNPQVYFMPVMCQHCDQAPCENVCPVAATPHSTEGLNQMAYNRCIGTRYCMNNCPYRVRRFNWFKFLNNPKFDYNMNDELSKMQLNPDVVVRLRGVVEKCSFCVQRIQDKKLVAKREGRRLRDGEVVTACMQACPTNALVFGDLKDETSMVAQMVKDERSYNLLEELHTLPGVSYQVRVRNSKEAEPVAEEKHS